MVKWTCGKIDVETFAAFEADYRDARVYRRRAEQFREEGQHFSVVFNVAAVALERYLVALCELHGTDPGNHNYTCLMDTIEEIVAIPPELNREIRSLDSIFGICSLENYNHGIPEPSDTERVLAMCGAVGKLFDPAWIAEVRDAVTK